MKYPRMVYVITNDGTGKKYVGSSANPKKRFQSHMSMLRSGNHPVEDFQDDHDKGFKSLSFKVVDIISNDSEAYKEYQWMARLCTRSRDTGYNYKDRGNYAEPCYFLKNSSLTKNEQRILKLLAEFIPQMDDMSKGYFLGYAEAMARQKEEKEEKKDESSAV